MRQISEHTKELIQKLCQPKAAFDLWRKKRKKICDLIEQIERSGESAVIPDILYLIFSKDDDVSLTAVRAIDSLMHRISTKDLIWFDQYFRQRTSSWSHYGSDWNKINPNKIKLISKYPGFQLSLLALLSFHGSGYVREEAIKRLDLINSGEEIPFILLRLNDWVDQVRGQSAKAFEKRITKSYAPHLIPNIYLIAALSRYNRYDHSSYIGAVHQLLRNIEMKEAVKEALISDDFYVRRECYKILLKSEGNYLIEVIEQGAKDSDVIVRNSVIKSLKRLSDNTILKKFLEKLETDPFMPNRREVLNFDIKLVPEQAQEKLINALFDQHPSIRYDARYYLSKMSNIDFAIQYKDAIKNPSGKNLNGIISGLGETGESDDAKLIVNYLQHQIAKIRKNSIRAIAKLSAENYRELFISGIRDDSPRVSREATLALLQCQYQSVIHELWDKIGKGDANHVIKNVLFLTSKLSKWESISYIIKALALQCDLIKEIANYYLDRWLWNFNRSFTEPTNTQKEQIKSLIRAHRNEIGVERIRTIEFNMKTF
jgi:HEAT repeat protein